MTNQITPTTWYKLFVQTFKNFHSVFLPCRIGGIQFLCTGVGSFRPRPSHCLTSQLDRPREENVDGAAIPDIPAHFDSNCPIKMLRSRVEKLMFRINYYCTESINYFLNIDQKVCRILLPLQQKKNNILNLSLTLLLNCLTKELSV